MKKILKIGALEAQAGQKVHGFYSVEGTDMVIPVTLINGTGEGKVLLLTAGVHPDEYPGIAAAHPAIRRTAARRYLRRLGYRSDGQLQRFPGEKKDPTSRRTGKNLNRLFPGNPNGDGGGIDSPGLSPRIFTRRVIITSTCTPAGLTRK